MSNNMKTPMEKEEIINRYMNGESAVKLAREYEIDRNRIYRWLQKYEKDGLDGLVSKTGKSKFKNPNAGLHLRKPKNKIEELELEILKKDIEIARLKKVIW